MKKLLITATAVVLGLTATGAKAEEEHELVCDMMIELVPKLHELWSLDAVEPADLSRILLSQAQQKGFNTSSQEVIKGFVEASYLGYHSGWNEEFMVKKFEQVCEEIKGL